MKDLLTRLKHKLNIEEKGVICISMELYGGNRTDIFVLKDIYVLSDHVELIGEKGDDIFNIPHEWFSIAQFITEDIITISLTNECKITFILGDDEV